MSRTASREDISDFQRTFQVSLPADYVAFLLSGDVDRSDLVVTAADGSVFEVQHFFGARPVSEEAMSSRWGRHIPRYTVGAALRIAMRRARELRLFPIAYGENARTYVLIDLDDGKCFGFRGTTLAGRDELVLLAGSIGELLDAMEAGPDD